MSDYEQLEERLGHRFNNPDLLKLALTHPSVAHEHGGVAPTNQRLEFLGDAVLQLVLTHELYVKFPTDDEGPLSKARAKLVNGIALAERAAAIGLGPHLILSHGEELSGGRTRVSTLADAFEAVLGAMYLDAGLEAASRFILGLFEPAFSQLDHIPSVENPKGELQELLQGKSLEAPCYKLISTTGPDHDRVFVCTVSHGGEELGRGTGKSKKVAESEAAQMALARLCSQLATPPTDPQP